ncbi:hypothetical protein PENTCL1PPCAC_27314 [Pristionchus entomophagus]|uniref:ZP domain-containing protein n=1 Tax=Pristionchus entomophagus TaxID=358040 RepID=A0AAV5UFQ5_9BILA|nr:hypothetical protein PENTCL1PPCAC_27314 [Pristionchus entomophagus]
MGLLLRLSLLITVVSCQSDVAVELVGNYDRIITVCSEDRMEIHLRKDLEAGFSLEGDEPECKPVKGTFKDYDGKTVQVKTWSLPLKNGDGPCGLRYVPVEDSQMWMHETTMYGPDKKRTVSCTRTGVLDKRGARIVLEQMTPRLSELKSNGETVEVEKRATISAFFQHRFPIEASISLHPVQCWIVNEKKQTRRLVIDGGCPLLNNARNQTIVTLGSESADEATGDHPHIFFNADPSLFEHEDSTDMPPFRLQCNVMPCKGLPLNQQIIGVARCPAISKCQYNKKMTYIPTETFEINQDFSLTLSSSSIPPSDYRPLRGPIYPGEYWMRDMARREAKKTEETLSWKWCVLSWGGMSLLILIVALLLFSYQRCPKTESLKNYLCKHITTAQATIVHPEKKSSDPIFEEYASLPLQQVD